MPSSLMDPSCNEGSVLNAGGRYASLQSHEGSAVHEIGIASLRWYITHCAMNKTINTQASLGGKTEAE